MLIKPSDLPKIINQLSLLLWVGLESGNLKITKPGCSFCQQQLEQGVSLNSGAGLAAPGRHLLEQAPVAGGSPAPAAGRCCPLPGSPCLPSLSPPTKRHNFQGGKKSSSSLLRVRFFTKKNFFLFSFKSCSMLVVLWCYQWNFMFCTEMSWLLIKSKA